MNKFLAKLKIDNEIIKNYKLPLFKECKDLIFYGINPYGKMIYVNMPTYQAWHELKKAAELDQINMEIFSGFRSVKHQAEIIQEKINKNIPLDEILRINALPGYSEHHTGFALDLYELGAPDLNQKFIDSAVYPWLCEHAEKFGFYLSYPEDNQFGIMFEPWHWCYRP